MLGFTERGKALVECSSEIRSRQYRRLDYLLPVSFARNRQQIAGMRLARRAA